MTDNPMSSSLIAWGATFTPAVVAPGQPYWQLVSADGPEYWGGRVSVFVDVINEAGVRVVGVPVAFYWNGPANDRENVKKTEPKTGDPFAVDWPMNAGGHAYGVHVADGLPSDDIFGFGMGDHVPHQVFKCRFQRAIAGAAPVEPPAEPPQPPTAPSKPLTKAEIIEAIEFYVAMLKVLP